MLKLLTMDPYFKPILIASSVVILLNTFLALPIIGFPMLSYFIGGVIAVFIFRSEKIKETENENYETKLFDISVLGIATGIVVGSILTLVMAINLNNPESHEAPKEYVDFCNANSIPVIGRYLNLANFKNYAADLTNIRHVYLRNIAHENNTASFRL